MSELDQSQPADLAGSVDERIAQLASLEERGDQLSQEWLLHQLRSALEAWAKDETQVDRVLDNRTDY
jgi:hypothetical protein